jgi:uncharacterized protein YjiS (DUF1127 family)
MTTTTLSLKRQHLHWKETVIAAMDVLSLWSARSHQRKQMLLLEDHQLADLGIEREQLLEEASQPFWK